MIITKGSGLNDTIYGKVYAPVKQYLTDREQLHEKSSILDQLFAIDTTKNFAELYGSETNLGDFKPVDESGIYPETEFQGGYDKVITPCEWKQSFGISQTMIEDAKMGKIKRRASAFVSAYARTKEKFGAAIYSNAVSTTMNFGGKVFNIAGADGKALFATDHSSITGGYGVQTNVYDTSFSYDNLGKLEALGSNFRDDDGERLAINFDTIVVPFSTTADAVQLQTIFEVLNADGKPDTANRAGNYQAGRWNVIKWPFLSSPSGLTAGSSWFFLIDSNYLETYAAMVWLNRVPLSVKSYVDENTDNNIWKGRARYAAAPVDWRFAIAAIPGVGSELI